MQCALCDQSFSLLDLKRHLRLEHSDARYCVPCDLVFASKLDLELHQQDHHPGRVCRFCGAWGFTSTAELKQHERQYHSNRLVECPICTSLHLPSKLDQHLSRHSDLDRFWECPICYLEFRSVLARLVHIQKRECSAT